MKGHIKIEYQSHKSENWNDWHFMTTFNSVGLKVVVSRNANVESTTFSSGIISGLKYRNNLILIENSIILDMICRCDLSKFANCNVIFANLQDYDDLGFIYPQEHSCFLYNAIFNSIKSNSLLKIDF